MRIAVVCRRPKVPISICAWRLRTQVSWWFVPRKRNCKPLMPKPWILLWRKHCTRVGRQLSWAGMARLRRRHGWRKCASALRQFLDGGDRCIATPSLPPDHHASRRWFYRASQCNRSPSCLTTSLSLAIAFQRPSKVEPELDRKPGSGPAWSFGLPALLRWCLIQRNWQSFCFGRPSC